jgi:hypothetical protein
MRPLRYSINVSLDGCCDHRAMLVDEDAHRHAVENIDRADALLLGRVTFAMMEAGWRRPVPAGARPARQPSRDRGRSGDDTAGGVPIGPELFARVAVVLRMPSYSRELAPLRILVLRALVGYALLRALLVVVAAILDAFAGRGAGAGLESPVGVVLLAMLLGAADIRRRGESLFWANLGYPPVIAPCLIGGVALSGELILAWIRS